MGRETDLFKAAKSGNNTFIERTFASCLKRNTGHHVFGTGFGSIRKSANPNIQDDAGYTLVHHATLHGQSGTVSLLLKCGASVTIPDSSGSCPLHLAAWKGDLEIVRILATQGPSRANVNQQSDSDDTALHLAAQYGYSDVVEFLLQRHADPLLMNIKGETPLDLASQYGHLDAVHLLISHCPEMLHLSRQQFSPLHLAARNGHTVVALSLINAGISVNTVCERGSPLHEAAMCGKTDTVRLLLDKGVNLDLVDNKGHTVLGLLAEYTADKAREIQTMIEEHLESRRSTGLQQLGKQRLVAVAQKACSPLVKESSALAFKKGDKIDVQRMTSKDVFIGSVHGRTGSFLATDVDFFKERNGRLVTTDVSRVSRNLSVSSTEEDGEGGAEKGQREQEGEKKNPLVSKRPPYEHIPAFPTEVVTSPSSTTSEQSLFSPSEDQPREIDSEKGAKQSEKPGKRPNKPSRAKLSKKEKKFQLQKDDGTYTELQPIDPQDAKRQFGESLRLNPVGPAFVANRASNSQDTQTHTAHNADQMVEDSSFMGSYYVLEIGNFDEAGAEISRPDPDSSTADESQKPENSENPEQQGQPGYYMLEVKNFETENSLEDTLTASGHQSVEGKMKRSSSSLSQKSYENLTLSTNAQKKVDEGHYDTPSNITLVVGSPAGRGLTDYVNIELKPDKTSAQTSAPVNIPVPKIVGENGAGLSVSAGSHSSGPSSLPYENIELSSSGRERVVVLEGQGSSTLPISIPRQTGNRSPVASSYSSQSSARSYENVDQAFMNKRGSRTSINVTPGGEKSGSASPVPVGGSGSNRESEGKKKGKRREEIYEAVSIGGKGGSRHKRTRSDPNASPTKLASGQSLFGPERNSPQVGRHSVAVLITDGNSGNVEAVGMNGDGCHGNGVTEGVGEGLNLAPVDSTDSGVSKERPLSGGGATIIENSADPFAGLVISASKQLEESTQLGRLQWSERRTEGASTNGRYETLAPVNKPDPAPFIRGRAETIWDDDRVQQEWTQIDSLLSDMNISPPLPSSPTHQPHPTIPSHDPPPVAIQHHPNREVFMWLQGLRLGGYASTLESNGFDRLNFLGEKVLAMDDLEDIGITNRGEQYTIMAAASLLPPPPEVGHASSLSEWLRLLQLENLEGKFAGYSLQKLAKFWDIELTSVVGIELLGYRKRLQYGIAELRSAHPDWMQEQQLPVSTLKRTPASSSPIDSVSFIKDYRNIRSTASPRNSRAEQPVALALDQPPRGKRESRTSQDSQSTLCESWQQPINFEAKYLGSVVVAKVRGTQSTEEACLRLKTSTENMKKIPQIILAISWKGVKFVDAHTMNVVSTHAVRDISHCSQDIEDKTIFAYITKDQGHSYCHVFMAASTEIADEIIATIGQAFEVAYQKVMKARSERAVSVESTERREKAQSKHSFQ